MDFTKENSLRELKEDFSRGRYNNVVIFSGAGVSTNSGIPDYRSKDGYFQQVRKAFPEVKNPEILFSRAFHNAHPEFKQHPINQAFLKKVRDATPGDAHKLAVWFHKQGKLLRVFTQNVDGLYQKAGLPDEKIVEYHGSLLKDTVVLYGDSIPTEALSRSYLDLVVGSPDLIIIMGTSMKVVPFAKLPEQIRGSCSRVLVNHDPSEYPWSLLLKCPYIFTEDVDKWSRQFMDQ